MEILGWWDHLDLQLVVDLLLLYLPLPFNRETPPVVEILHCFHRNLVLQLFLRTLLTARVILIDEVLLARVLVSFLFEHQIGFGPCIAPFFVIPLGPLTCVYLAPHTISQLPCLLIALKLLGYSVHSLR